VNVDVVADAGNSFIKWGRCEGGAVVEMVSVSPVDSKKWQDVLDGWPLKKKCQWVISGSDPACGKRMAKWLSDRFQQVRVLHSHVQLPIKVNVDHPDKVGLDRLCNAVAVNSRKASGVAAVVIDAGTAVTVDYVDEPGVFQGGAILPGLAIMANILERGTAALPLLKVADWKKLLATATAPGKFTEQAIALGISACFHGGIERVARDYAKLAGNRVVVYIGGGDGGFLPDAFPLGQGHEHQRWPEMTLEGIRIAGERL
jgi:type III pantothenate kinase